MKCLYGCFIISFGLLVGCDEPKPNQPPPSEKVLRTELAPTPQAPIAMLPFERAAPALGTKIQDLLPSGGEGKAPEQSSAYQLIAWGALELPGQGMADIIKQYQPLIDRIPEGDPEEDKVMEEMQKALDAAPINPAMNGKKIRLPGFIAPLDIDETKALVKDFLLVPYYGACIHLPPPPLSQTILVQPQAGKGIGLERIAEPVWVYGTLISETAKTDLATAGYQIQGAYVELYQDAPIDQALNFNPTTQ